MLETFTTTTFAGHLGETFRIHPDGRAPFDAALVAVTPLGAGGVAGGRRAFSLVFRGPRDAPVPQRIYRVEHDRLGAFDLFLVPIGPDGEGMRYEAVFT